MLRHIRRRHRLVARLAAAVVLATAAITAAPQAHATDLQLPRFVSLKAGRVNVRVGPSNEHQVKWIFVKSGLPVEVVQEFENWRRIRDSAGEEGWVYHSLLSGRRTALVEPWANGAPVPLHLSASKDGAVVAILEPRVVAKVDSCDGAWCFVEGKGYKGYLEQVSLWGVYPDEVFN